MPTALLLIDMQYAFFTGSFVKRGFQLIHPKETIENAKKLLDFAREKHWSIIFTRLEFAPDYSDAGLLVKRCPEIISLHAYRESKIDKIVIAGVLTNVCVESTIRSAFEKGFEIITISNATTTYDKELKNASLKTIEKHFGTVMSCDEIGCQ